MQSHGSLAYGVPVHVSVLPANGPSSEGFGRTAGTGSGCHDAGLCASLSGRRAQAGRMDPPGARAAIRASARFRPIPGTRASSPAFTAHVIGTPLK